MSPTSLATKTSAPRFSAKKLAEFRLIPRIETYPRVVEFAQTPLGKIALLSLFGAGLRYFYSDLFFVLLISFFLLVISLLPEYRRFILAMTPIMLVIIQTHGEPLVLGLTLGVMGMGAVLYWCAMRWPKSLFGKRPIVFLLTGFSALIVWACAAKSHTMLYSVLWALVGVMASYVWFIAYALTDRSSKPGKDSTLQLATFRPMWGSTNTPFPKGAANLRRIEAKTPEKLATVQLRGLKLLAWAILLGLLQTMWNRFFHGTLHIPSPIEALTMSVHGTPAAWHVRWESQILFFFEVALSFAVTGHLIISTCRMAGFDALRNSCRPLSSTTISEYFNRFYYYFKELLVDMFFYPTFLRYWKGNNRMRTFFATFVAIAFGNSFYHLTRDWQFFQRDGVWKGLAGYQVLFFYNLILATAVGVSQLRKSGPKTKSFFRRRIVQPLGVLSFYCVLGVFGDESRLYPLAEHIKYLASLFFIRL